MTNITGPRYKKIALDLHQRITLGEFDRDGKMPTQRELAKKYSVAIPTIKQALSELQREGLISGIRGSGTFVRADSYSYQLRFLSSLDKEIHAQHRQLETTLVDLNKTIVESTEIRDRLRLNSNQQFISFWRLRSIDQVPMILQQSIVSAENFAFIELVDLANKSLYSMLEKNGNIVISSASESIRAINLPNFATKLLQAKRDMVGLISTRVSKDKNQRPVILDYAYLPGDRAIIESDRIVGTEGL